MPQKRQNLVFLMEPSEDAWHINLNSGHMCLNRFCIDEDAAFELSGVYYLEKLGKSFDEKFKSDQITQGRCYYSLRERL